MNYKLGLTRLRTIMQGYNPEQYFHFTVLESRLQENLDREQRYSTSEQIRSDRSQILDDLNHFTKEYCAFLFIDLCRSDDLHIPSDPSPSTEPTPPAYELWVGGTEIELKGTRYSIHVPVTSMWPPDHSALYQRARAQQVGSNRLVCFKQLQLHRATSASAAWKSALEKEARLLEMLEQTHPHLFPRSLMFEQTVYAANLIHVVMSGFSWAQNFGVADGPLSMQHIQPLLRSAVSLGEALKVLHSKRLAHRFLTPETILLFDTRRSMPQDVGLATWKYTPGEGPDRYRAPEQTIANKSVAVPGPHTDIYQLGMVLYRLLTGRLPLSPQQILPLRTYNEALSPALDAVIQQAIAFQVKDRWRTIDDFSMALRKTKFQ